MDGNLEKLNDLPYISSPQPFCHEGLVSWKTIFPWTGGGEMVSESFKYIIFIVHFIFVIITSAPPQIIRN